MRRFVKQMQDHADMRADDLLLVGIRLILC